MVGVEGGAIKWGVGRVELGGKWRSGNRGREGKLHG